VSGDDDLFAPTDPLDGVDDAGVLAPPPRKPGDDPHEVLPRRPATPGTLWKRVGIFAGWVALAQVVLGLATGGVSVFFVGVSQLLAVVPLAIYAAKKKDNLLLKVTLIGAGVVFMLNAACFGVLAFSLRGM